MSFLFLRLYVSNFSTFIVYIFPVLNKLLPPLLYLQCNLCIFLLFFIPKVLLLFLHFLFFWFSPPAGGGAGAAQGWLAGWPVSRQDLTRDKSVEAADPGPQSGYHHQIWFLVVHVSFRRLFFTPILLALYFLYCRLFHQCYSLLCTILTTLLILCTILTIFLFPTILHIRFLPQTVLITPSSPSFCFTSTGFF